MLTDDFVQPVAHQRQEVLVRVQDAAIQIELDYRHHPVHRIGLVLQPTAQ